MKLHNTGWGSRNRQNVRVCPKCQSSNLRLSSDRFYWLCGCGAIISRNALRHGETERRPFL